MSADAIRKLAIIAGGGDLPRRLAEVWRDSGKPVFVIGLDGFAEDWITQFPHGRAGITAANDIKAHLLDNECDGVAFAGRVARPNFRSLRAPDASLVKLLGKILIAAMKGDDAVMRVVVDHIASWGVTVVRPEEIITSLRAQKGVISVAQPGQAALADIARGLKLLRTLGEFDFGQGCVVCDGYVLAVEAAEGTDAMLSRVATLPENLRGTAKARRGVLIKAAKPQQDRRFDLPTIGRHTIEGAAAAGLAGIAVEAGQALIVGRDEVAALADRLGLFIAAVDHEGHVA